MGAEQSSDLNAIKLQLRKLAESKSFNPFDFTACCSNAVNKSARGEQDAKNWIRNREYNRSQLGHPLLEAVAAGEFEDVKCQMALDDTVAKMTRDSRGNTALHIAAQYGRIKEFELIAQHEPDLLTSQNEVKNTPAHKAAEAGKLDVLHWIQQKASFLI